MEEIIAELTAQGVSDRYIRLIVVAIDDLVDAAYDRGFKAGYADGLFDGSGECLS